MGRKRTTPHKIHAKGKGVCKAGVGSDLGLSMKGRIRPLPWGGGLTATQLEG